MSIHLKRLDFTETINAMLCISARHAVSADGARQQALDEIAASLNNVAAIIARHKLAGLVNGPIPPVPPRGQPDDDDPYEEELADDEPTEDAPAGAVVAEPDMHPRQKQIYRYIATNPGCTPRMVADNCGMSLGNVGAQISLMRKDGIPITGTNTRLTKYRIGA